MANIQEKIAAFLPEAVFEEGQYPTFTVPAEKLPVLARYLRDEDELQFDNLAALVGVDWGETLGVVYYLNSVKYNHWVILKVVAADRKERQILRRRLQLHLRQRNKIRNMTR